MYGRTNALASYGRVANAETNPIQQVIMLYDGAMKFFSQAAADIEAGDLRSKAEHSTRALDIVGYLQSILDFEKGGDVAAALDRLYADVSATALRASARLDAASMRRAAALLAPVRDSWVANASAATPSTPSIEAQQAGARNSAPLRMYS